MLKKSLTLKDLNRTNLRTFSPANFMHFSRAVNWRSRRRTKGLLTISSGCYPLTAKSH
nr:MAG TPA: hypothetical protein [Caudoviricetes sp.]